MILICTALPSEAGPLITKLGLKAHNQSTCFKIYNNTDVYLTISGIGKVRMGAAIAYCAHLLHIHFDAGIINFGIAGHRDLPIGKLVLAKTITNEETGMVWHAKFRSAIISDYVDLITKNTPVTNYPDDSIFDMEASGFCEIASLFTTNSMLRCVKIVSDNLINPVESISKQKIVELITMNIDQLSGLICELKDHILSENQR